jgi:hypothetical protein
MQAKVIQCIVPHGSIGAHLSREVGPEAHKDMW